MALLGRSWLLQIAMPIRLRLVDLGELDLQDLMELRRCLQFGWVQEFRIPRGLKATDLEVWMTPTCK